MKMKLLPLTALLFLFACSDDKTPGATVDEIIAPGKVTPIETLFDAAAFTDQAHAELLKELQICMQAADPECPMCGLFTKIFRNPQIKATRKCQRPFCTSNKNTHYLKRTGIGFASATLDCF